MSLMCLALHSLDFYEPQLLTQFRGLAPVAVTVAVAAVHQLLLSEVAENVFNKFRVRERERTIKIIDAACAHQSGHRQMKTKTK